MKCVGTKVHMLSSVSVSDGSYITLLPLYALTHMFTQQLVYKAEVLYVQY